MRGVCHLLQHLHHDGVLLAPIEHSTVGDVIKSIAAVFLRLADSAEKRVDGLALNKTDCTKKDTLAGVFPGFKPNYRPITSL